ncbi:MAG: PAS domain S-box protein [Paracoccaceae bacterium]
MNLRTKVLEQLVKQTNEGFWFVDVQGKTLDVNPAMCRVLGRDRDAILGRTVFDFVNEENAAVFERELASRRLGKHATTYEISLTKSDGTQIPCINNATSVFGDDGARLGSIGLWKDISRQKAVETELRCVKSSLAEQVAIQTAELRNREKSLREAHRLARLGNWKIDSQGKVILSEEAFEIFGISPEDFDNSSQSFNALIHPEDRESVLAESQSAWETSGHHEAVYRIVRPSGEVRTIRQSAAIIRNETGQAQRFNGTVQDITQQVEAEKRCRHAQKMEAIGQLSGGVAHDFNNLLAVIMGAAEFLQSNDTDDHEMVDSILRAAKRGKELTHRMLAYARKQPLKTEQFKLVELIDSLAVMLRRTLSANIDLVLDVQENTWTILADPNQAEDAILNLVINARDAMPQGGRLYVKAENAPNGSGQLSNGESSSSGDFVVLTIKDNGIGMTADVLERAIEPFYTTKDPERGSGLGLSMVYGFAQQTGGELRISSEPGQGTQAELYFPRATADHVTQVDPEPNHADLGNKEHILVIEDDPAVAHLTQRILQGLRYKATIAGDASEARELLKDRQSFDLVLSDVVLPNGLSGPAFAKETRIQYPDLKIVFMSGYPTLSPESNCDVDLVGTLISKPFRREHLATVIRNTLDEDLSEKV